MRAIRLAYELAPSCDRYSQTGWSDKASHLELQSPENLVALLAPRDKNALLMQGMKDSSLRQLWWLTNMRFKARNRALTQGDIKNEGTPGCV
jgi:hypothetical protein